MTRFSEDLAIVNEMGVAAARCEAAAAEHDRQAAEQRRIARQIRDQADVLNRRIHADCYGETAA